MLSNVKVHSEKAVATPTIRRWDPGYDQTQSSTAICLPICGGLHCSHGLCISDRRPGREYCAKMRLPAAVSTGQIPSQPPEPSEVPTAHVSTPVEQTSSPTRAVPPMNNEEIVGGRVIENNLGCEMNAACYLRLLVDGDEIRIVYHYGEWPRCNNSETAREAIKIGVAAEVEVLGRWTELDGDRFLSTCDSPDYYIRVIKQVP